MPEERAPRLCVLIDADNIPSSYAESIFEEITALGEASVRRIYGDWSAPRLSGWARQVAVLGLVADQRFSNTKGKNASDISLVIAAMDFLHSGLFDGFVLVSSDSDFTRLASRIREQGLDVFGIGEMKTPETFRRACKRFIYVENLGAAGAEPAAPPAKDTIGATAASKTPEPMTPTAKALPLILKAMRDIDAEGEWYSLAEVGAAVMRANPDFDTRTYGKFKLSDLLRGLPNFELRAEDRTLQVRRKR